VLINAYKRLTLVANHASTNPLKASNPRQSRGVEPAGATAWPAPVDDPRNFTSSTASCARTTTEPRIMPPSSARGELPARCAASPFSGETCSMPSSTTTSDLWSAEYPRPARSIAPSTPWRSRKIFRVVFAENWTATNKLTKGCSAATQGKAPCHFLQPTSPRDRVYLNDATYRFTYLD